MRILLTSERKRENEKTNRDNESGETVALPASP